MKSPEMKNKQLLEYYSYLDALRESGVTNMFGAGQYLEKEFNVRPKEAREILLSWMKEFE